jgi:Mce-associated membrane protein
MPSGKRARGVKAEADESQAAPEADEAVVDEPAAPVEEASTAVEEPATAEELTTSTVDEPPAKQSRRRNFLRRRKNQPEETEAATAIEVAESEEATATEGTTATEEAPPTDPVADKTTDDDVAADSPAVADAPAEEAPDPEPVLVPHRPAGKRLKVVAAAAAVLFVAGGAFLGSAAQPVIANRALVETKLDIARTAANAITTLWSYTPENMDSLADRSAGYLTGDFAFQYRKFIDSIVATNKQAQITNTTSVLGSAVESVSQSDASAVVYTNSVATSPVSKNIPSLRYLSYRLEMKRDRSDWRITRMTTITSLDLTPQL